MADAARRTNPDVVHREVAEGFADGPGASPTSLEAMAARGEAIPKGLRAMGRRP